MSDSNQHSKLRIAIEETRKRYGFPDIEERYPGALLDAFLLKDAISLEEQFEALQKDVWEAHRHLGNVLGFAHPISGTDHDEEEAALAFLNSNPAREPKVLFDTPGATMWDDGVLRIEEQNQESRPE